MNAKTKTTKAKIQERVRSVGLITAEFMKMRIKHPRLDETFEALDALRAARRLAPREPAQFSSIFAPTHSGKSMAIRMYIERVVAPELIAEGHFPEEMPASEIAQAQKRVLHVTLSENASPATLSSDILGAMGDPRSTRGEHRDRMRRTYDMIRALGVELIVLDEIQHLSANAARDMSGRFRKSGTTEDTTVTDALKKMLIQGLVPMVFVGIEEARPHIFSDSQMSGRCLQELDFGRLDLSCPTERRIFEDYCGRIGLKLKQHGLFEAAANFIEGDTVPCMHAVAGGRIGMVSRHVHQAAMIAAKDPNAPTVTREHLSLAVQSWAIPRGFIDFNPFTSGARPVRVRSL